MDPVSKSDIQRALINVTKSQRTALTVAADFSGVDWASLDFYGWRDPRFAQRGYLTHRQQGMLVAVAVGASSGGLTPGRKVICGICHAVDNSNAIGLFTARRGGPAGRAGNTVGTYICVGLNCSAQLRHPTTKLGRTRLGTDHHVEMVAADMLTRLDAFLDAVRAQ